MQTLERTEPALPAAAAPRSTSWRGLGPGLLAVALLAVAAYATTPLNFWVADDYNYLVPKGLARILGFFDPTVSSRAFYRPLNWTSWAIDYDLWGRVPFGWHLSSMAMHVVTVLCAALIVAVLLKNRWLAVLTGALFAVHPAHPETVTWIGGRADLVCGLFYLAGVLAFALFLARRAEGRTSWGLYALSLLTVVGAFMGKEMGVTLPVILLLTDAIFFTPGGKFTSLAYWRGRILLHLPFFAIVGIYLVMRYMLVALGIVKNTYAGPGLLSFEGIVDALASNVLMAIGIFNGNDVAQALPLAARLATVILAVVAVVLLVRWLGRPALYAALWVLVTVLPTYNLAALRWLFIPSFGVCLLAALAVTHLGRDIRISALSKTRVTAVLATLLVAAWGLAVVAENVQWYQSGEEARSILNQIKALAPDPQRPATIYFAGAPSRYKSALLFNTGLPSALPFIYPQGGVALHEIEQPLPDPVIVQALQQPSVLQPNPLFMGYRQGRVVEYPSLEQLLATGVGK